MNKKGNAAIAWLVVLVIVFVLGVVYVSMTQPYQEIHNKFYPDLNETYQPTALRIQGVWKMWPILMILGVILWALVKSAQGRNDVGGFYG